MKRMIFAGWLAFILSACQAPFPASIASVDSPVSAAATKQSGHLERMHLRALDEKLHAYSEDFGHTIGDPGNPSITAALTTFYAPIFANAGFQKEATHLIDQWTIYESGFVDELRATFTAVVIQKNAPTTDLGKLVAQIASSRRSRWNNLARLENLKAPTGFHLYRGESSLRAVEAVVRAWQDSKSDEMVYQNRSLTSWSMNSQVAQFFGNDRDASVIYEAYIPMEQTFLDKWADGGNFVQHFFGQDEVVVGVAPNSLKIPKQLITVTFKGKTYVYSQRSELVRAWKANSAPTRAATL